MKSCLIRPASMSPASCRMLSRFGLLRELAHEQRRADILQRGIDPVSHQLHHDRLMRAGHDQARARFRHQIVGRFGQPAIVELVAFAGAFKVARTEPRPASLVAAAIFPASACVNAGIWLAGQRSR